MKTQPKSTAESPWPSKPLLGLLVLLCVVLGLTFDRSFSQGKVLFSNDGPLGANMSAAAQLPGTLTGWWLDLNWLGLELPSAPPSFSSFLRWFLGPLWFAKLYAPVSLLACGLAAGIAFRLLRFPGIVCVIAGIAAPLNGNIFSNACWGQGSRPLSLATSLVALGLIGMPRQNTRLKEFARLALAGGAVGLGIMEGFDVGAIYSLLIAAFAVFVAWLEPGKTTSRVGMGIARTAMIAIVAGLLAAHTLEALVGTQVSGISGTQQDKQTKEEKWDWATQWSTPKAETLRVAIPGLFGYRMDTAGGGQYWGAVGQTPGNITSRYSGSGEYAGMLVLLLAAYAISQALRGDKGSFDSGERKLIWFWAILTLVSLLFAYGRHAPFYQLLYQLPYFSTVRNPMKFMHPFHLALLFLFAYGMMALHRQYKSKAVQYSSGLGKILSSWWANKADADRRWTVKMLCVLGVSMLAGLIYTAQGGEMVKFLQTVGFPPEVGKAIFKFTVGEIRWFILFTTATLAAIVLMFSGWLSGPRARFGWLVLGLILLVDLYRANTPWIVYENAELRYATNPVIELLRQHPEERRVTITRFPMPEQVAYFPSLYNDWLQHLFPYYNIQSLDITQLPRVPEDIAAFNQAVGRTPLRLWELTNTRYFFTLADAVQAFNAQMDPQRKSFRTVMTFGFRQAAPGAPVQTEVNPQGPFAIMEYTAALPRIGLYTKWEVISDDTKALARIADPAFSPRDQVVLSNGPAPVADTTADTATPGIVSFKSYSPKRVEVSATNSKPSVLLLNDRFQPGWSVTVDGSPKELLRCNYTMRGVHLEPGTHTVVFSYEKGSRGLQVSLVMMALMVACMAVLAIPGKSETKVQ